MKTNYEIINIDWKIVKKLTKNIIDYIKENNIEIDTLVPVIRGGMPLALLISANIKNLNTASIQIKRSLTNETNAEFGEASLLGITNIEAIKGKNILVTEDTVDHGKTLDCVIQELKKYHPKNIYIATLYNFNKDKYKDIICGKYMQKQQWIIFPWEENVYE